MGAGVSKKEEDQVMLNFQLSHEEVRAWTDCFEKYATNKSKNKINLDGFCASLGAFGSRDSLVSLFNRFDVDRSGSICFTEFMMAMLANSRIHPLAKLKYAFDMIDSDHSGYIEIDELKKLVNKVCVRRSQCGNHRHLDEKMIEQTFTSLDENGDGRVTFKEFETHVLKNGKWILTLLDIRQL